MTLDAVAACYVAVHRSDKAEQATVRTISMEMATCFDEIAGTEIFTPYTVGKNAGRGRRFERPDRHGSTVVCDVKIDDRVWCDEYNLPHRSFELGPIPDVVGRVRVMGAGELRHSNNR